MTHKLSFRIFLIVLSASLFVLSSCDKDKPGGGGLNLFTIADDKAFGAQVAAEIDGDAKTYPILDSASNPAAYAYLYGIRDSILVNPFSATYSQSKVDSMFIALNSTVEYQNLLMTNYMWLTAIIQDGTNLKERFNEIINLLNKELGL